jgi:uncharacterized protein YicC (UPF0701 family)
MGIASEMKELTRDITSSRRNRANELGEIREGVKEAGREARDMIHSFGDYRRETNRHLKQDLAQDKARRKSETTTILKGAQNILKDFEASRKEAGTRVRKDLSRGVAERQSEVKKTLEGARKLMRGFRSSRQDVSHELRENLSSSRVKNKSEVEKLLRDAQGLVKDFQRSRREAGSQLRGDLAQNRANIESDVKQMQSGFRKARGNVSADLKGARAAWQGLAGTKQAGKGGKGTPLEMEAPAASEEITDLEIKLLTAVNEHPEGIPLAGIADRLGVAPVVLGRVSNSLVKKGKIRKEERLYFPAASESEAEGFHFKPPFR